MLYVIEPGFLTTVQDTGRPGWARYGIPPSGPMDRVASYAANALVGNDPNAAVLEITLTGLQLQADRDCLISVCGSEFNITVGALHVPTWHSIFVRSGYTIRLESPRWGARAYLAINGGIDVPIFLGSRSTYLHGAIGGHRGRRLQRGDQLPVGQSSIQSLVIRAGKVWPMKKRPKYTPSPVIHVVLGPQQEYFDEKVISTFLNQSYIISGTSDRMGLRLDGHRIQHKKEPGIVSDGIVTGSIQIPPDGMPIIMMVDHQTTGGYPKIATVVQEDIPLLAQCLPGNSITFQGVSLSQAYASVQCP